MKKRPPHSDALAEHMFSCETCRRLMNTLPIGQMCEEATRLRELEGADHAAFLEGGGEVFSKEVGAYYQHLRSCPRCKGSAGDPVGYCLEGLGLFEIARDDAAERGATLLVRRGTD